MAKHQSQNWRGVVAPSTAVDLFENNLLVQLLPGGDNRTRARKCRGGGGGSSPWVATAEGILTIKQSWLVFGSPTIRRELLIALRRFRQVAADVGVRRVGAGELPRTTMIWWAWGYGSLRAWSTLNVMRVNHARNVNLVSVSVVFLAHGFRVV